MASIVAITTSLSDGEPLAKYIVNTNNNSNGTTVHNKASIVIPIKKWRHLLLLGVPPNPMGLSS